MNDLRADRTPARARFHQQRVDALGVVHRHAGGQRMEQQLHAARQQQLVGRALVGGAVVGLRQRAAEDRMRLVQPAQRIDALQQFVGHAMHHALHLAMHVGMQAAEVGDAGRGAHAAEEAVALDQQHLAPGRRRAGRGGDAGRAAAQHQHLGLGQQRRVARGFDQHARDYCAAVSGPWFGGYIWRVVPRQRRLASTLSTHTTSQAAPDAKPASTSLAKCTCRNTRLSRR